jgi:class 3 adenylate cyclase
VLSLQEPSSDGRILCRVPQERRLVTVLFADMVGSTTLTVTNDAEVVRERLEGLFDRARAILVDHGATVEKFIGDAVMAVFGVPVAHEDDAERAIRAAQALVGAFAAENEGPIQRVELRVGVNSGEVATGGSSGDQFLVTGEAVNVAARLQAAAAPGEILAGPLTRRLTSGIARFGAARRIEAKGIGVIEAWPLDGLISAVPSGARGPAASATFVGREREMSLLATLWGHTAASARPYLVTVIGAAGIGKTRMVEEFSAGVPGALILRTRCPPYGEGLAFWPIEQILGPTAPGGSNIVGAFRRHLEALALDGPVALVIEDLHWAQPAFLDAVEHIVDRARGPILVLCTARSDLLATRLGWGGGRPNAASVELGPLDDASVERLIASLDPTPVPGATLASLLAHGEGNPLFVQEYLRAVREDDRVALGGAVPPTLRALVSARLDRVPAPTRAILRSASVIGRTFGLDALSILTDDPGLAPGLLDDAEQLDLVAPLDPPGVASRRYSFAHMLFRDVAYAGVPKAERIRQHDVLSRWIEARAPVDLGVAAHHAEQAYLWAVELASRDVPAHAMRAFALLQRAAEDRRLRSDSHAALSLFRRALAVAGALRIDEATLLELRARAVIARLRIDGSAEAIAELDEILPRARVAAPSDVLVQLLMWRQSISLLDDAEEAGRLIAEAIGVAERAHDAGGLSYARWAAAELRAAVGDLDGQRELLESVRRDMRRSGTTIWLGFDRAVPTLVDLAENALERGDGTGADEYARAAVLDSENGASAINRFRALEMASRSRLAASDLAEAGRFADAATVLAREINEPWASARAALATAAYRRVSGDLATAGRLLDGALLDAERAARPTMRGVLTELRAALATVLAASGDLAKAERLLAVARAEAPRSDVRGRRHIERANQAIRNASGAPLTA